jgi:hypothetical protein
MDQAGKVTVLSLSSDLVDASMSAARQRAGALKGGPLQETLKSLPETTSKLAVVNVAGAMQFAVENMELPSGQVADRVREAMAQLAQASAKTTVRLQTSEEANSFAVHLSVDNLPPISRLIAPIKQIADGMAEIEGRDEEWGAEPVSFAGIAPTDQTPAIDGKVDGCWAKAQAYKLEHNFYDSVADQSDCSASFKTLYDKDNLYVLSRSPTTNCATTRPNSGTTTAWRSSSTRTTAGRAITTTMTISTSSYGMRPRPRWRAGRPGTDRRDRIQVRPDRRGISPGSPLPLERAEGEVRAGRFDRIRRPGQRR